MTEEERVDAMNATANAYIGNRRFLLVLYTEHKNEAGEVNGLQGQMWTSYEPYVESAALGCALSAIGERVAGISRTVRDEREKS